MTIHLHPTAALAERVLLPGDPGRALSLAQQLMHQPRMFNHNRGLWGYSGAAVLDGEPLTIQATGMGGPSAAIVISELADLGAHTLMRVGTCGALDPGLCLGELVAVTEALSADGSSRALGAGERVGASPELLAALRATAGDGLTAHEVVAVTTDLFYDPDPERESQWAAAGASVVDMETATVFALGALRDLRTGALLAVTDRSRARITAERIDAERLGEAERRLGELAMRALARG